MQVPFSSFDAPSRSVSRLPGAPKPALLARFGVTSSRKELIGFIIMRLSVLETVA
jgi:hypothetical protein